MADYSSDEIWSWQNEERWRWRTADCPGDAWDIDPDLFTLVEGDIPAAVEMLSLNRPESEFFVIGKQIYECSPSHGGGLDVMISEWRFPDE